MRSLSKIGLAVTALLAGRAIAAPLVVSSGNANDIVVTAGNTINETTSYTPHVNLQYNSSVATTTPIAGELQVSFKNNLASNNVHAYVVGLDPDGLVIMLHTNGTWYYPTATASSIPVEITADVAIPLDAQGSTTNMTLPGYISSGRIYFADGNLTFYSVASASGAASVVQPSAVNPSDPSAGTNWGFIELTWTAEGGLYADLSYVDFVGLPLGIAVTDSSGAVQTAKGVAATAVAEICAHLLDIAARDGQPWAQLCMADASGRFLRALAPADYVSVAPGAFDAYWTGYVEAVWARYATTPLTIDTQTTAGLVNCSVVVNSTSADSSVVVVNSSVIVNSSVVIVNNNADTGSLVCTGDNRSYAAPSAADIWGCNSGPFALAATDNAVHMAVVPRLCAAFHRSTLLLAGGEMQPGLGIVGSNSTGITAAADEYYYYHHARNPTDWYSMLVHEHEVDGKGYAFGYDDVTPDGAIDQSGLIGSTEAVLLSVTVGGPD